MILLFSLMKVAMFPCLIFWTIRQEKFQVDMPSGLLCFGPKCRNEAGIQKQKQPLIGSITKGKTESSSVEEKQQSSKCSTGESSRKHKLGSILKGNAAILKKLQSSCEKLPKTCKVFNQSVSHTMQMREEQRSSAGFWSQLA